MLRVFLKKEVFKYITKIIEKKKLPYEEFFENMLEIFWLIEFVDKMFYSDVISMVKDEVNQIDSKDIDYVALAYKLNCPLWTNDKKLRKLKCIKVLSTEDLIESGL